jgi:putative ABC transport system substrate-binding protein
MTGRFRFNRRRFLAAAVVAAVPSTDLRAQAPAKVYRIAVVVRPGQRGNVSPPGELRYWRAWREELGRLGYVEGHKLKIDIRTADSAEVGQLAAELARDPPDAIFVPAQSIVSRLKTAAVQMPIVTIVVDPVGSGLALSLARPGGNITGFSLDAGMETMKKRITLLKELSPGMSRMAVLMLRAYWEGRWNALWREAASEVGVTAIGAPFESRADEAEMKRVFAGITRAHADGLFVTPAPENFTHRKLIAELALSAGLPNLSLYRENVEAGGLISYGPDIVDIFRRAAGYIDQILRGSNPAEMPFQQPTKFDLAVNLKTAKALGLKVPATLLALADDVIE